jgi:DNA-binding response OmpR family regulator
MDKKKVVVVDDDTVLLNLMKVRLTHAGYAVLTADGGKKGLELIKRERPDLVILDLIMPDMDGSAVAAKLKEDSLLAKTPVFFLTGLVSESETTETDHAIGGRRFIAKPFDAAELVAMIKDAVG